MTDQGQKTDGGSQRERSRTRLHALSEFLARAWLAVVWLVTPTAILFWDSGSAQDLYWVLLIGFVVGLAPLLIIRKLVVPCEINPLRKIDWKQYGVLALIVLTLILTDKLTRPGILVDYDSTIPSSTVALVNGPGSLVRLNESETLYDFSLYRNHDLASEDTLKAYLRSGDVIYKDAGYDEVVLRRAGRTSSWNIVNF